MFFRHLKDGWNYVFNQTPQQRNDTAQRSAFMQYQEYPENNVQGMATLVQASRVGVGGKYWNITQAPQVIQTKTTPQADLRGGGTVHGNVWSQPLIDTKEGS